MNEAKALAFCHVLREGTARIRFNDFYASLKRTIGANEDYARSVWKSFQDNPAAFLASRQPQSQSLDLLKVILRGPQ